ncbi:hypothetical protein DFP72DRAFT_884265 [Ephemerocybe angulata]|uniref:F-box domain-containing protein n=1 Tax=Ephemerocybe angulata TaxID=980116 RepID=A0A8H6MD94_9AGAR|nr:hypothetical protein DFP72DRAFT_884265 [Tulosesus angulatus]
MDPTSPPPSPETDSPPERMLQPTCISLTDVHRDPSCGFLNLSGEMMMGVLHLLDHRNLIQCAQVSRLLNLLAVQAVLDQHAIWKPQKICTVKISSYLRQPFDVLSALLMSTHIDEFAYLAIDVTGLLAYANLMVPLERIKRLITRIEAVDDVLFSFVTSSATQSRPETVSEKELRRIWQSLETLLSTFLSKSCSKIQFSGLYTCPWTHQFIFKRGLKNPGNPSTWRQLKGYLRSSKDVSDASKPKAKPTEEDLRYVRSTRMAKMFHIYPSPSEVLDGSKLVRFDSASCHIFRPPFAAWTFAALQASQIEHFTVGFKDLPSDIEESQYILNKLAAVLPEVILLTIYSVANSTQALDILAWTNSFLKLGTLSLPLTFPTDMDGDKINISLPELWRLECSPDLLGVLFAEEGRVELPKLNSVAITHYGLSLQVLAECIPKAREMINRRTPDGSSCFLFVALRLAVWQLLKIPAELREGKRPTLKSIDISKGFEGVSPLEVSLPGTREDVRLGIYDNDIMAILTLFPDVESLILSSTEWYLKRPPMKLDRLQMKRFRKRSPKLTSLVAY